VDTSPRFPTQVLEQTDEYIIVTNEWGMTKKDFRDKHSTPRAFTKSAWWAKD